MSDLETEYWLDDLSSEERENVGIVLVEGIKPKRKKVKKQARRR